LVKLRLGSADRATQVPGDFGMRQALHVVQQEDCAITGWQLSDGAPDGNAIDGSGKLQILHREQIQKRGFSITLGARPQFNRHGAMMVGTQAHQNHVHRQAVQPSRQSRVPAKRGELQKTL
jgi:hypothetical protein